MMYLQPNKLALGGVLAAEESAPNTEEYYEILGAPHKEIIWFEHSGHNPWVTESAAFVDVVVNTVLAGTQPAR